MRYLPHLYMLMATIWGASATYHKEPSYYAIAISYVVLAVFMTFVDRPPPSGGRTA